jgi:hypothetical protein
MNEKGNRPIEAYGEYGKLRERDTVSGEYEGRPFTGQIKSFTKYLDTGEVVANIETDRDSGARSIQVKPEGLKFKMRLSRQVKLGPHKKS